MAILESQREAAEAAIQLAVFRCVSDNDFIAGILYCLSNLEEARGNDDFLVYPDAVCGISLVVGNEYLLCIFKLFLFDKLTCDKEGVVLEIVDTGLEGPSPA